MINIESNYILINKYYKIYQFLFQKFKEKSYKKFNIKEIILYSIISI